MQETYDNPTTITSILRCVKAFVLWLHENGYCEVIKIKVKKDKINVKSIYTTEEFKTLLQKPSNSCSFAEYRNWVMVSFLIGTGIRINSLIHIRIKDIDMQNELIKLTVTKNGKGQIIPLSKTLKKILMQYLNKWENKKYDYLFPSSYNGQLSPQAVTHAINKYNKKHGIQKTSCHLFRHTFAHNYLMHNGDIFRLQKLLGHSTLDMVKIYSNMNLDDLKQDYDKMNLLDTLQKSSIKKKQG